MVSAAADAADADNDNDDDDDVDDASAASAAADADADKNNVFLMIFLQAELFFDNKYESLWTRHSWHLRCRCW